MKCNDRYQEIENKLRKDLNTRYNLEDLPTLLYKDQMFKMLYYVYPTETGDYSMLRHLINTIFKVAKIPEIVGEDEEIKILVGGTDRVFNEEMYLKYLKAVESNNIQEDDFLRKLVGDVNIVIGNYRIVLDMQTGTSHTLKNRIINNNLITYATNNIREDTVFKVYSIWLVLGNITGFMKNKPIKVIGIHEEELGKEDTRLHNKSKIAVDMKFEYFGIVVINLKHRELEKDFPDIFEIGYELITGIPKSNKKMLKWLNQKINLFFKEVRHSMTKYYTARQLGREEGIEEGIELGIEEGIELGREEGIELGREEAREEGKILAIKAMLDLLDDESIAARLDIDVKKVSAIRCNKLD
ncbi:hypothetical protein AN639_02095 [Candidatus Epulonipiscium fishelsonii]|uniref:Uncharacterized protein n=1 Tax=Candidatus Epulonipiscium fishelsonii TaxID=77094 RepID=A0ACC8XGV6_9FIRM|nr:hypothetical protein AN396_13095 [Epulopiscium sp. SCG-B11WGA-EpuloA1]ONI43866.1 hypothetical protein AN639_02095 [Epulopiscium sp. SCG-B05WGA-EpuloA1]ONI47436.1 hypothetical protein AN644_00435 [Epulopiscium sp. SCG-C06WGA-EpuloA1]